MASRTGRRRALRWTIAAGAAALAAWALVTAALVVSSALSLRDAAAAAEQHASGLQTEALVADIDRISAAAQELAARTDAPPWRVASLVPWAGSAAQSTSDLADAAVKASDAARRLQPLLPRLEPSRLRSDTGTVDVATLTDLADALRSMVDSLQEAADSAGRADPHAPGPVGSAVEEARSALGDLPRSAATAADALDVAAHLVGSDSERRWAVLMQNGSEARGTGGFLGAYALVDASHGRIAVQTVDTNNSLTNSIPNRAMPAQFLDLWTAKYTSAWNDYNLSRHFPYTGQLTRAGMAARGTPVTDVIALDATVVAAIMAGTGPLTSDGVTVSSQDAADFFNRRVYELYPDSAEKDAVVVDLMQQMLDRLSSGAVDLPAMVRALAPAVGQGRLLAWSSRQDDQELLEGWPVGGVVPDAAQPGPWMSASFNNSAGNKLDAFVGAKIDYRAATCGRGLSSATITLTNDAPPAGSPYAFSRAYFDQGPPGTTRLWTAVYGPVGARFRSASIDGVRQYVHEGRERGHPVWLYNLTVPQGGTTTLTVSFTEPPSDNLPTVSPQPMAVPVVTTASATCG